MSWLRSNECRVSSPTTNVGRRSLENSAETLRRVLLRRQKSPKDAKILTNCLDASLSWIASVRDAGPEHLDHSSSDKRLVGTLILCQRKSGSCFGSVDCRDDCVAIRHHASEGRSNSLLSVNDAFIVVSRGFADKGDHGVLNVARPRNNPDRVVSWALSPRCARGKVGLQRVSAPAGGRRRCGVRRGMSGPTS
jgi:hypothetical protein